MAKNDKIIGNILLQDKFVQMYCVGMKMADIAKEFGVDRSTVYLWRDRKEIKEKIEKYKQDVEDTGRNFIKGRYVEYLKNIDKLANQDDDKRTALSANQFLVEKMDGKSTTNISMNTEKNNDSLDNMTDEELEQYYNKIKEQLDKKKD
ncbi:helix-turn-helix domain-containing protein [Clostridium botulinum]